jgi:hypothetical protein
MDHPRYMIRWSTVVHVAGFLHQLSAETAEIWPCPGLPGLQRRSI